MVHPPTPSSQSLQGPFQPARRGFGVDAIRVGDDMITVTQRDVQASPFCTLVQLHADSQRDAARLLVVPPLSGHFPFVMRDLFAALARDHDVFVTDWTNARHVPVKHGNFHFDDNVERVMDALRFLGPETRVLALCQGGVPALAATALLTEEGIAPRALVLIAAPIDPLANPTRVVELLRERSMDWFESHVIQTVEPRFPGAGRRVYPASTQLLGLMTYLGRHLAERGELFEKLTRDDGADPDRFPFLDLYTSVMDLPDAVFLENIRLVFHERAIADGTLRISNRPVDCRAIAPTALMTIEGEKDDIAAPGQTEAAHGLCPNIPDARRRHLLVADCGHFSTFYGDKLRGTIAPAITAFLQAA